MLREIGIVADAN